jgi:hypothetical protein
VLRASSFFTQFQDIELRPQHLRHPMSCHVSPFSHRRNTPLISRARATAAHFKFFRPASYSGGSRRCAGGYSPCTWSACPRLTPAPFTHLRAFICSLTGTRYCLMLIDTCWHAYGEMPSELPLFRQPWRRVTPTQTTSLALLSRHLAHTLFDFAFLKHTN